MTKSSAMVATKISVLTSTFTLGMALLSGSILAQKSTVSDAQVQSNVLRSLAGDETLSSQTINVSTAFGTVTLTGAVNDEVSRTQAEKIVSHTDGVKKVIDQLQVGQAAVNSSQQGQGSLPDGSAEQSGLAQVDPQPLSQTTAQPSTSQQGQQEGQMQGQAQSQEQSLDQSQPQPDSNQPQHRLYRRDYERQMGQSSPPPPSGYGQNGYAPQQSGRSGGVSVQIPAGTPVQVRLNHWLTSDRVQPGTGFDGFLLNDIIAGNEIAIPRGATVRGTVIDVVQPGTLKGKGSITLQLQSVQMGGRSYVFTSDPWTVTGRDKTGQTVGSTAIGAIFGALIGGAVGGGAGAGAGALIGGAAGLGTSAISHGGVAVIPGEAVVNFRLAQISQVATVSEAEMQRLGNYSGPAAAYRHGPAGYAPYSGPRVVVGVGRYPYYGGYYGPGYYGPGYYGGYGRRSYGPGYYYRGGY